MHSLAQKAYGEVQHRTASPKEIEYEVFQQITDALEAIAGDGNTVTPQFAEAVSRNLELWTILAVDLMSDANQLDIPIRKNLLELAAFVRSESMKLLSGEGDLNDLVDINKSVMRGLNGEPVSSE